jgi:hypothetical protein
MQSNALRVLHLLTIKSWPPLILCMTLSIGVRAEEPSMIDSVSQHAIEEAIHNYIVTHPEVIAESLRAMEIRRREEDHRISQRNLLAHQADLLHDEVSPTSGNPAGDVTVVEFFDYRCARPYQTPAWSVGRIFSFLS